MVDAVGSSDRLHRLLLTWDYYELADRIENGGGVYETLRPVPSTFKSLQEYKDVFEPLLLEECASQMMRGMEEGEVLTAHPAVVATYEQKDDFMMVRMAMKPGDSELHSDNDLLLLTKDHPEAAKLRLDLHAVGFCEAHEGEQSIRVKFLLSDESQAGNAKGTARVRTIRRGLETRGSTWWVLKLSNMSTITREWVALQHAHLAPFVNVLLTGKPNSLPPSKQLDIPAGMRATMERTCNPSQMDALQAGLDGTSVVLIQGPPGTGKTRTILNLLSVIMHSAHKGTLEVAAKEAASSAANGRNAQAAERAGPSNDERRKLWLAQAPWLSQQANPRDLVPYESVGSATDTFGMARRRPVQKVSRNMGPKAHVLVCAPSNSALDEIVMRILKSGLMDASGTMFSPAIVRIGVRPHHSVASVSLDAIIDSRQAALSSGKALSGLERDKQRIAVLDEANIVCSTLSFAGSHIFYRLSKKFDVVVIDEAAQAVEPSVLVPLVMGCKQVYLVGDPVQLPATVISHRAVENNYDTSLFKRLQESGHPVKVLDTQYRMHPSISSFPSQQFYQGKLLDGEGVEAGCIMPWHEHPCFGPFAFFDVNGTETSPKGGASIMNPSEAHMALCLYKELIRLYPEVKHTASVAVISPYKAQVKLIRETFKMGLSEEIAKNIDINTIDGFQGREKDITIFSCVRALKKGGKKNKSIGFVGDVRRINVGITRARCSLLIIGNSRALQNDVSWAALIRSALNRGCLFRPPVQRSYHDWLPRLIAGMDGPVPVTDKELAALDRARARLVAAAAAGRDPTTLQPGEILDEEEMEEMGREDEGDIRVAGGDEDEEEDDDTEEAREARFAAMERAAEEAAQKLITSSADGGGGKGGAGGAGVKAGAASQTHVNGTAAGASQHAAAMDLEVPKGAGSQAAALAGGMAAPSTGKVGSSEAEGGEQMAPASMAGSEVADAVGEGAAAVASASAAGTAAERGPKGGGKRKAAAAESEAAPPAAKRSRGRGK